MMITKSVELDQDGLRQLFNAILTFSLSRAERLNKEQLYGAYILQQLYRKLRTRENAMIDQGRRKISIKFDSIQVLILVDVLQSGPSSMQLNTLLMELGKILPCLKK